MLSRTIDFRSDMLGQRSAKIVAAMAAAAAEPPEMEDSDPRKRALEERAAALLGFEDALFLPTCTMANQIVVRHLRVSGISIFADRESHLALRESSAATDYHGARLQLVSTANGHLSPADVSGALSSSPHAGKTPGHCIWLENTHNAAGGTLMPRASIAEICALRQASSAWLHIDGARIWNAAVACGCPLLELTRGADSLSVSLNKCLDAPVGGLLLGSMSLIAWARSARTDLGGRWRPLGILAAAALAALEDFGSRIEIIHYRTRLFHSMLLDVLPGLTADPPETNIVMLTLSEESEARLFLSHIRSLGVQALDYGAGRVRFVLHSGIEEADLEQATAAIRDAVIGDHLSFASPHPRLPP